MVAHLGVTANCQLISHRPPDFPLTEKGRSILASEKAAVVSGGVRAKSWCFWCVHTGGRDGDDILDDGKLLAAFSEGRKG